MIYKRFAANLRAQNWFAIGIEFAIVVAGVFVGTQVSNWNAERLEKRETQRMLAQLKPNLQSLMDYYNNARTYYATTRRYATVAFAGWRRDPKISDAEFVIAAYQASQIIGIATNSSSWSTVLGADQLRKIDDPKTRYELSFLMSADYSILDTSSVNTPYRQNVRRWIPIDMQDAIRNRCGDRPASDNSLTTILPETCDVKLGTKEAADAAAILRAHPELVQDLHWHMAAEAALIANLGAFEFATKNLQGRIAAIKG
jgi:hypothetical protein